MPKTFLEKNNLTLDDVKQAYEQMGTIEATAQFLGCSKPTLIKYLKKVPKDPTPWKNKGNKTSREVATEEWQKEVQKAVEHKLLYGVFDITRNDGNSSIGVKAVDITMFYWEMPTFVVPQVNIFIQLQDSTRYTVPVPLSHLQP